MGSYYYLAAQLPHLFYGQKPPMSSSEFKDLAESLMSEGDAALMRHLSLEPVPVFSKDEDPSTASVTGGSSTGCKFIDDWQDWERTLRFSCAKRRAVKLNREKDIPADFSGTSLDAAGVALKVMTGTVSPLEGEIIIDKARWDAIEALAGSDYFDRNSIFAYFLKLLLLERRQSFDTEEGFTEYKTLYASIMESGQQSVGEPK